MKLKALNLSRLCVWLNRLIILLVVFCIHPTAAYTQKYNVPIVSDSRIQTYVYSENEVFPIMVHYGYQTYIAFSKDETVKTISIGNSYAWKLTPLNNRLFIKALEGAAHTNMAILTNKRVYQFELESRDPRDVRNEERVYVIRFFYPDKNLDIPPIQAPPVNIPSITAAPSMSRGDNFMNTGESNYNYTLNGSESISPVKIFDDGVSTYMQFADNNAKIPNIYSVDNTGTRVQLPYTRSDDYLILDIVAPVFYLELENESVTIYNENY